MEVEKASSKSNGFFKIFDWGNKKSKKRLFTNSPSSEKATHEKDLADSASSSRSNLIEDDEITVISSIKGTNEQSCSSSSIAEEELITKKPTSVVARLMGLDSMPVSDPLSSPPFQPQLDPSSRKMGGLKPHNKMPSSPIERFQAETIPNKTSKMIPITYHKLFSPIKSNNNFASGRNADQIMDVASRIIDSNLNLNSNFRVYDSGRFASGNSKPVNRRLNVVQTGGDLNLNGDKGKKKINLPVQNQTRVNIPKRENANPKMANSQKRSVPVQNNRKQNSLGTRNGTQRLINEERNNTNNNSINNASFGRIRVSSQLKGNSNSNSNRPFENGESKLVNKTNSRMKRLSTLSEANQASTSTSTINNNKKHNNNNINSSNDILVKRSERRIQHNIIMETQPRNTTGTKKTGTKNNSNNIVSFTFTSPADKFHKNVGTTGTKKSLSNSSSENIIDGDYLGVLLEQKLRELTSGSGSPYRMSAQGVENGRSEMEISGSCLEESGQAEENESVSSVKTGTTQEIEKESINEKIREQINELSPFSILESCNSTESWESSKGGKSCMIIEEPRGLNSFRFDEVLDMEDEEEADFSESSSSITIITETHSSQKTNLKDAPEVEFIKEILNSVTISFEKGIIENKEVFIYFQNEEKDSRISKKMLFGCVYEFLAMKSGYYFGAGYNLWIKGDLFVKKLNAEEIFKEIWVEKGVEEESAVDLLVDGDMSSQLGKWVDFEIEVFENGSEIEDEILGFLIDEFIAELVL